MRLTTPLNLRETKRGKTDFFLIFHFFFIHEIDDNGDIDHDYKWDIWYKYIG